MVTQAYPGATKEAISYPACGGQSSCGGASYDSSASQGTAAVVRAVNSLVQRCPDVKIVLIGYSQGGQIMDNALCGGAGATLTGASLAAVKAAIFMGDPHNVPGLSYNVGTCTAGGGVSALLSRPGPAPLGPRDPPGQTVLTVSQFAARSAGFRCSPGNSSIIQSYCDQPDPYCCKGNDQNAHQQYVNKYGRQALQFIQKLLGSP